MALFTDQGLQWISQSVNNYKSLDSLRNLMSTIMSCLKLPDPDFRGEIPLEVKSSRTPLPPEQTARKHVQGKSPKCAERNEQKPLLSSMTGD